jgi:hypothetical protein
MSSRQHKQILVLTSASLELESADQPHSIETTAKRAPTFYYRT